MKRKILAAIVCLSALASAACAGSSPAEPAPSAKPEATTVPVQQAEPEPAPDTSPDASLLYQGHASIRILTGENRVIYIDPYCGDGYDPAADLILITHGHYDHNNPDLVKNRTDDCEVITWKEALKDGVHQTFDLGYVTVEAVEAGNNPNHSITECVGYVLTLADGVKVYISGDTSATEQMNAMASMNIDYAFFCCDGQYNMGPEEASRCAELVGARTSIPYHTIVADGVYFDENRANEFTADGALVLKPGETIELTKE